MAQNQLLEMFRGENRTFSLAARDYANNPSNLTGKTVTWKIAFPPYEPDWPEAIFTKTGTVTDAANGLFTVAVVPADTFYLSEGNYTHQAYTTDTSGSVSLVTEGLFHIRPVVRTTL